MKKIHPSQKNIIIISAAIVLAFSAVGFFVYRPTTNTIGQLKAKLADVNNQIQQIEGLIGENGTIGGRMDLLYEQYRSIDSKFPNKEEEALGMLSDLAQEVNAEVISVKSQPKVPFLDENQQEVEIDGKTYQKLSVSIEMKASYADLVAYLETIKKYLPAYLTVEQLRINKSGFQTKDLAISLELTLYLLS